MGGIDYDIRFYFDPVCPFAWMTSKWVRIVQTQRDYTVDWRFISLRLINAEVDYEEQFPSDYEAGHTAGLKLLRVATRTRAEHGREAIGSLYESLSGRIFDDPEPPGTAERGTRGFLEPILEGLDLPIDLAAALDDESWDVEIQDETNEALALTGRENPITNVTRWSILSKSTGLFLVHARMPGLRFSRNL